MDRRQFLAALVGANRPGGAGASGIAARDAAFGTYANASLPARKAVAGGLEAYQGPWTATEAAHLLRRTLFGPGKEQIDRAVALGLSGSVDALLDPGTDPAPPLNVSSKETAIGIGDTWVDLPHDGNLSYDRSRSLQAWWFGLLWEQDFSIREKMTLFWNNHFATDWRTVGHSQHMYRHLKMLRASCLGDFKALVRSVTLDPAMLRYLNGNTNTKGSPNENYARELQELFTIGKGPERAPGDYTNYTEDDVKAAAKVLTGWRDRDDSPFVEFRPTQHDTSAKTFSGSYGSAAIAGRTGADGAAEVDDLVDLIFAQPETARYICRKLYRFFVYYVIDDATEAQVIQPMADLLVAGNWKIGPVLAALFRSAHFHDPANRACFIKTPLDLLAGTLRNLRIPTPDPSDLARRYQVWLSLVDQGAGMQMDLASLPDVAGWPAFHQDPVYYEAWISSETLPRRVQFTDRCMGTKGYQIGSGYLVPDLVAVALSVSAPGDLDVLVSELSDLFSPLPLTDKQKSYLRDALLAGSPDYEWANLWEPFRADPTDAVRKAAVESRLRTLLKTLMAMSEYQLC